MLRVIGRIILVLLGFFLATLASAAAFLSLTASWYTEAMGEVDPILRVLGLGEQLFRALDYLDAVGWPRVLLPGIIVVIAGEVFQTRSLIFYLLGGAIAVFVIPMLVGQAEGWQFQFPNARYTSIFLTSGFVGGLIYWFVAGRRT